MQNTCQKNERPRGHLGTRPGFFFISCSGLLAQKEKDRKRDSYYHEKNVKGDRDDKSRQFSTSPQIFFFFWTNSFSLFFFFIKKVLRGKQFVLLLLYKFKKFKGKSTVCVILLMTHEQFRKESFVVDDLVLTEANIFPHSLGNDFSLLTIPVLKVSQSVITRTYMSRPIDLQNFVILRRQISIERCN